MSHTILLMQPSPKNESRTYSDFNSLKECLETICKMYEEHLKRLNPSKPSITLQKNTNSYIPLNKDAIKEKVYDMLRSQAGR